MTESLVAKSERLLGDFFVARGFECVGMSDDQSSGFGAAVDFENDTFRISISRDRGFESIEIHAKARPRPRAHLRSWSMSHILGFLDGGPDHADVATLEIAAAALIQRADEVLDVSMINSDEMSTWANIASRRLLGQTPR
tara:strand:+ start:3467 stop:3886 length:420 start_codon:yes stop_codon:yes gene_type:complete